MTDRSKPDYILEPRYILQLYFERTGTMVRVKDPSLITDEMVNTAWAMMNDFVMDIIDELQLDATDELFRELEIELCYWIVFREMRALKLQPLWEQRIQEEIVAQKRKSKRSKGKS